MNQDIPLVDFSECVRKVELMVLLGDRVTPRQFADAYAVHIGGHVVVRRYGDDPAMVPRAVYPADRVHAIEHYGEHPALPPSAAQKAQRQPRKASEGSVPPRTPEGRRSATERGMALQTGVLAPRAPLPTEEALERFLKAAPPAESHLPERRYLESGIGDADGFSPKVGELLESTPTAHISLAGQRMPLPTHMLVPGSQDETRLGGVLDRPIPLEAITAPFEHLLGLSGEDGNQSSEPRRRKSKPLTRTAPSSHKKPKPPKTSVILPLLGLVSALWTGAFRVRHG